MSDGTDWCRHYQGVGRTCRAGIDPRRVCVDKLHALGQRSRLYPCFEEDGVSHGCPQCSYYTPEERQALRDETDAVWRQFMDDLAANKCPFCGAAISKRKQVGRCVYADPCGHLLYQGRA